MEFHQVCSTDGPFFNKSPDEEKEKEEEESLGLIVGVNESPPFNLDAT